MAAGYSSATARAQGARLLTNANIKLEIEKRQKELSSNLNITQEKIVQELALLGFSSLADIFDIDSLKAGELKIKDASDETVFKCIADIKIGKSGVSVKAYDKIRALELLGKHLGLFNSPETENLIINNIFDAINGLVMSDEELKEIPELAD